jgi:hypothetical protein
VKSGVRTTKNLEKYRADFEDILRVVELSGGFVLLPIALPGPDLALDLAHWLTEEGHLAHIISPETDEEWRNLASALLSFKPAENGLVMVVAGGDHAADLSLPLRLVNERRDAIAKHLNCPLLWSGSGEFLLQTGQMAPDFWSIRAVERRIEGRAKPKEDRKEKEKKLRKHDLLDEALRQGDRKSSEILFLAQLRKIMAAGSQDEFAETVANIPNQLENIDPTFAFELTMMKVEMARRRGNIADALEMLDALEEKVTTPDEECRIDLLRGRVWERAGDAERAEKAYGRAEDAPASVDITLAVLAGLYYARHAARTSGLIDWSSNLRLICDRAKGQKDRPLNALASAFLAESIGKHHDLKRARRILRQTIELHEASKDEPTILFGGEVAEAIERAESVINAAQEAAHTEKTEPLPRSLPPAPIPIRKISILDRPWLLRAIGGFFLLTLAGLFVVIVGILSNSMQRNKVHCFQGPGDEITCGETLEHCEKLRLIAGPSLTKPCQKPLFAPSTP